MKGTRWIVAALVCGACDPGTGGPPVDDGFTDVSRDCPADVGTICPYAGAGFNGMHVDGDAAPRLDAWFSFPTDIAFPSNGDRPVIFDWNNHRVRAVNPDPADGFETVAGELFLGDRDATSIEHPVRGVFHTAGTLLLADDQFLSSWDPVTGTEAIVLGDPADGTVNRPMGLVIDPTNENLVYWVDGGSETIRRWDAATDAVEVVAGNGTHGVGCADGDALATCFGFPHNGNPEPGGGIALTDDGATLYVADSESHTIRVIDLASGTIATLSGTPGVSGFADGASDQALWAYPTDLALDGNTLFVADTNNHRVRQIDLPTGVVSTFAGTGLPSCVIVDLLIPARCEGQRDGGDDGPAIEATLYRPFGVTVDPDGHVVVTDTYDHRLRIVYR